MTIPDWQRAHGGVAAHGTLRQSADDFRVDEVLGFEPDGVGEHDMLLIEKRDTNTQWLARQLAAFAGIPARDVGYAGLKDRHAVTSQWFSVRRPAGGTPEWQDLRLDGVRVLGATRNSRKLRNGAHRGNRFRVVIRDLVADPGGLDERLQSIAEFGVPNYFGEQRFGFDGANIELARSLFAGKRLRREKRSIAISAARSLLFNVLLQERVRDRTWDRLGAGDTAALDGSNSVFTVEEPDTTILERLRDLDLHPVGELWGRTARPRPLIPAECAAECSELADGLERLAEGGLRALRLAVRDLNWTASGNVLTVDFYLCRGSYATAVLREVVNYRDASSITAQLRSSNT